MRARRKMSSRDAKRMMKRMGVGMNQLAGVEKVIFQTDAKEIIIKNPEVVTIEMQGQKIFQVTGEEIIEKPFEKVKEIPEEDARLVADQTGKSVEEAKKALKEVDGDLAKAILLLQI